MAGLEASCEEASRGKGNPELIGNKQDFAKWLAAAKSWDWAQYHIGNLARDRMPGQMDWALVDDLASAVAGAERDRKVILFQERIEHSSLFRYYAIRTNDDRKWWKNITEAVKRRLTAGR